MANYRLLIHVPIIHTQADMGKLGEPIMVRLVQELGDEWWQRKADVAGRIWEEIEKSLLNPDIPFQHARLYQDALPICGREYDIVQELAASGSRNHALLLRLIERGATIMVTESPELLIEEYRRVQRLLENPDRKTQMGARAPIDALIKQRDSFIAKRIESTLTGKEFGIVFLEMLHSIAERLPADMRVGAGASLRRQQSLADPARSARSRLDGERTIIFNDRVGKWSRCDDKIDMHVCITGYDPECHVVCHCVCSGNHVAYSPTGDDEFGCEGRPTQRFDLEQ